MADKTAVAVSGLKQELSLAQGVGLLSTSLLGTGVFAVPALAAQVAQGDSLWAWPVLIALVFPIAIAFAALGRHFPSAGGAAHFVGLAFGPRMAKVTGWLFLSVIPVGLPAALQIAAGFWQAAFGWSANIQTLIAMLVVALVAAIWWRGGISPAQIPWPALDEISPPNLFHALAVMFWCFVGLEAFAHLATEFRNPERDFPRALLFGLLIAGAVYWGCTVAVLHFHAYSEHQAAAASLPGIVVQLFGQHALWVACVIGYLACFASVNIYTQSFARLVWSQAQDRPASALAKLSAGQAPVNALSAVVGCCLLFTLLIYTLKLPLDMLLVYANGIFVLIYLLCMLAGCRILHGRSRLMAAVGLGLCLLLMIIIGWKSLYALGMFALIWLVLPRRPKAALKRQ